MPKFRRAIFRVAVRLTRLGILFWVPVLVWGLIITVWVVALRMVDVDQRIALREARASAVNLTDTYAALMVRSLDQIDLTLGMIRRDCERKPCAAALHELQQDVLVPSSLLFEVVVSDRNGLVIASNRAGAPRDVRAQAYFKNFASSTARSDTLMVALTPEIEGQRRMIFARRMARPDGSFGGVIALTVDSNYFTSWYDARRLGYKGVLGIADQAGHVIVSRTGDQVVWLDPAQAAGRRSVMPTEADDGLVVSGWDDVQRFMQVEPLSRYPFWVFVGLAADEQLVAFEANRRTQLAEASFISLLLLVVGTVLWAAGLEQERYRHTQQTYHAASEASRDANVVLHTLADASGAAQDFEIVDVNRRALDMSGRWRSDLVGRRVSDLVSDWPHSRLRSMLGDAAIHKTLAEYEWRNTDERLQAEWLSVQCVPVADGVVVIARDITSRKRAEAELQQRNAELTALNAELSSLNAELTQAQEQLAQSDKLASIGLLAAGVAHEINNPVGFVQSNLGTLDGYIQTLFALLDRYQALEAALGDASARREIEQQREDAELDYLRDDIPALMKETKDGITRVRKIVQDLKNFSRVDSQHEWQVVDLHEGIDSTLNMVHNELKYKADVIKEYGELPPVECLPSEINQVVMNLLVNAGHAISSEQRGRITVRTGAAGEQVWIEVADTGSGIAPDHLAKIFDPFFTTKPVGKGTGLGLSLSYGIVKKHGGTISVESTVGQGTCFRITLPTHRPAAAASEGLPAVLDAGG